MTCMRIAIAGTHISGKTTHVEALGEALAGYTTVEEPYHQMVAEGFTFDEPPSADDFWEQLMVFVASVRDSDADTIFDRSPLDFLAYASRVDRRALDHDAWAEAVAEGLETLDAVVFCGIEDPDRIVVPRDEDRKLRRRVDAELRELVVEDRLGLLDGVVVLEVEGPLERRVAEVRRALSV